MIARARADPAAGARPAVPQYVALFVVVVCLALLANGMFEVWFSYQEHKSSLVRIQREQAEAAAAESVPRHPRPVVITMMANALFSVMTVSSR
jgi:hypothetical protein